MCTREKNGYGSRKVLRQYTYIKHRGGIKVSVAFVYRVIRSSFPIC